MGRVLWKKSLGSFVLACMRILGMNSRYLVPLLCLTSLSGQTGPNVSKVIDTYCSGCHNGSMRSPSRVLLDQFDSTRISADAEVWARAYRQLQAGTMPPVG